MAGETPMRISMKEDFYKKFPSGMWVRIESSCGPGVPDIHCCASYFGSMWIEAKCLLLDELPKRAATKIKIGLRPEQVVWIRQYQRAGGTACVVAKVGKEWMVFYDYFPILRDGVTLAELRTLATAHWTGSFDFARVLAR